MKRYWAMLDGKMSGPFEIPELVSHPSFNSHISVFVSGEDDWKEAVNLPAITRFLRTGELPKDIEVHDDAEAHKITSQNWREAVVEADVEYPTLKYSSIYTKDPALSKLTLQNSLSGARPVSPAKLISKKITSRQGQKVLLLVLGLGLLGTYQPAVEFFPTLLSGISSPDMTRPGPAPHVRIPWHRIQKLAAKLNPINQKHQPPAVEKSKVVEVDASPLPDGMVMKTVTTVDNVSGAKIFKTKTYIESAGGKKKHH
jgi:hypothetical protein